MTEEIAILRQDIPPHEGEAKNPKHQGRLMGQAVSAEAAAAGPLGLNGEQTKGDNSGAQDGVHETEKEMLEKLETMNCVKNKIDVLIEGCLLAKNPGELWKTTSSWDKTDQPSGSKSPETSSRKIESPPHGGGEAVDTKAQESSPVVNGGNGAATKGDNSCATGSDREVGLESQERVKTETKDDLPVTVKQEKVEDACVEMARKETVGESNTDNSVGASAPDSEKKPKKAKISKRDLVLEAQKKSAPFVAQKNLTTFQTFIEKVLDSSLQQVSASMADEKPTRILERCCETEQQQKAEALAARDQKAPEGPERMKKESSNTVKLESQKVAPGSVKDSLGVSKRQMVSLKDHIEKLLEQNFKVNESVGLVSKSDEPRKRASSSIPSAPAHPPGARHPGDNNFSPQGLVNNMISQSLRISEMLSPPPRGAGPEGDARTANFRPRSDIEPGEIQSRDLPPRYMQQGIPHSTGGIPHTNTGMHHSASGIPHTNAGMPHSAAGFHHSNTGMPHNTVGIPHTNAGMPNSAAGIPHSNTGMPHSVAGNPHSNAGMPHSAAGIPHSNTGMPHSVAGNPHSITGMPHSIQGIPHSAAMTHGSSASPRMYDVQPHPEKFGHEYQNTQRSPPQFLPQGSVSPRGPVPSPRYDHRDRKYDPRDVRRDSDPRGEYPSVAMAMLRQDPRNSNPSQGNASSLHPQQSPMGGYPAAYSPRMSGPVNVQTQRPRSHPSSGQLAEQRSPSGWVPGNKQIFHLRDCSCPSCIPQSVHSSRHGSHEHKSPDHAIHGTQRSPTIPGHQREAGHHGNPHDQVPAMMRPSHVQIPPGFGQYHMPKLLPTNPPITSPKEFSAARMQMVPGGSHPVKGAATGSRLAVPDRYPRHAYSPQGAEERGRYPFHYENTKEDQMPSQQIHHHGDYNGPRSSYNTSSQDSTRGVGQHDRDMAYHQQKVADHSPRSSILDLSGANEPASKSSEEAPLDLSCKRPSQDGARSQSFSSPVTPPQQGTGSKMVPNVNNFIKNIASHVDKICQENKSSGPIQPPHPHSAPSSSASSRLQSSHSVPQHDIRASQQGPVPGYQRRSPQGMGPSPPHAPPSWPHSAPPYPGMGIRPSVAQQYKPPMSTAPQQHSIAQEPSKSQAGDPGLFPRQPAPGPVVSQHSSTAAAQQGFDTGASEGSSRAGKRNNVSKHEPIQNIIGNHNPNDILYLFCRLCTQTYGSPYGFRKHFRNQHGFQPRQEHAIVQTISAIKSAIHTPGQAGPMGPVGPGSYVVAQGPMDPTQTSTGVVPNAGTRDDLKGPGLAASSEQVEQKRDSEQSSASLKDGEGLSDRGNSSVQDKDKSDDDDRSTKCLQCPECGKTFQLNDFGSYKRHCRQHSQMRVLNGPYSCSECPLTFPEQQMLKEHFSSHIEASNLLSQAEKAKPPGVPRKHYSCVQCDRVFTEANAYMDHIQLCHDKNDQPPKLSPQIDLSKHNNSSGSPIPKPEASPPDSKEQDIPNLVVIPCQTVVKQAAESNSTSSVCPDSSSEVKGQAAMSSTEVKSSEEKVEEAPLDNVDSGYSSSTGSNSALLSEEKQGDKSDKSPSTTDIARQRSVDSALDVGDDKTSEDYAESFYKHKKFYGHRKRENSMNLSPSMPDSPVLKKVKVTPPETENSNSSLGVSSTLSGTKEVRNGGALDVAESDKPDSLDGMDSCVGEDGKTTLGDEKGGAVKGEARHNLPFVWDRVTRSKVGRKSKAT